VFLPNWQAIADVFELLMDDASTAGTLQVFVLHSLLPMQEQQEAFTHAPPGEAREQAVGLGGCNVCIMPGISLQH
jgi:HrpA-like RNA helicase